MYQNRAAIYRRSPVVRVYRWRFGLFRGDPKNKATGRGHKNCLNNQLDDGYIFFGYLPLPVTVDDDEQRPFSKNTDHPLPTVTGHGLL